MSRIRPATPSDLDAITWIVVAACPADPVFSYRYPYMSQYPDEFAKFTRISYERKMAETDKVILVYECPSIEDPSVVKAVAFSMWQLPPPQRTEPQATAGDDQIGESLDLGARWREPRR